MVGVPLPAEERRERLVRRELDGEFFDPAWVLAS